MGSAGNPKRTGRQHGTDQAWNYQVVWDEIHFRLPASAHSTHSATIRPSQPEMITTSSMTASFAVPIIERAFDLSYPSDGLAVPPIADDPPEDPTKQDASASDGHKC